MPTVNSEKSTSEIEEVKFYYDYKSPFAYLALEPVFALESSHRIKLRSIPNEIDIRATLGGDLENRSPRFWDKVRYFYVDARRFANERGLVIRGPQKIFDSRLSLISGLYADQQARFVPYSKLVFEGFFRRELDIEDAAVLEQTMRKAGCDPGGFHEYANGRGIRDLAEAHAESSSDHVFGVPTLVIRRELFWGYDRLGWVTRKLDDLGLRRAVRAP